MEIIINETYTVYPADQLNWSIRRKYETTDENGNPVIREKNLSKYFSRPQYALEYLYNQYLVDDPTECANIAELIQVLEKSRTRVFNDADTMIEMKADTQLPSTPTIIRDEITLKEPSKAKLRAAKKTAAKTTSTRKKATSVKSADKAQTTEKKPRRTTRKKKEA